MEQEGISLEPASIERRPTTFEFVKPNDPILTQEALDVTEEERKSSEFQNFVEQMVTLANGKQEDGTQGPRLVGLAGPQVGKDKKLL